MSLEPRVMRLVRGYVPPIAPALGAGLIFTLSSTGGEKIAFQPEAGSTLQRVHVITGDYALDEMTMIVDGEDLGGVIPSFELSMTQETRIEVTDVLVAMAEGRPKKLERTFDALAAAMKMTVSGPMPDAGDQEFPSSSPLEGKRVVFEWNDEKGAFDLEFAGDAEGDAELLEGLSEDMDLRAFLPSGEVQKDDSWSVPLTALDVLYMPGGNLHLEPEGAEMDDESMAALEELFRDFGADFADQFEGECTCTYAGARDEDGVRVAEIAIEIEVTSTLDLSELISKVLENVVPADVPLPDISLDTADLNVDFEGAGTLLWNLQAGRLHSFQMQGDVRFDLDFAVGIEAEGQSHALDAAFEVSGSMSEEFGIRE